MRPGLLDCTALTASRKTLLTIAMASFVAACSEDGALSSDSSDSTDGAPLEPWLDPSNYGTVRLLLTTSPTLQDSILQNTARIDATLEYSPCVVEFYRSHRSALEDERLFGGDAGSRESFDACAVSTTFESVGCEVAEVDATLETIHLEYSIDDGNIEGEFLHVGPIPRREIVDCSSDEVVGARRIADNPLTGYGAAGNLIWSDWPQLDDAEYTEVDVLYARVLAR